MRAALQPGQVGGGLPRIGGLVEPGAVAFQDLVGADYRDAGMACRDLGRLGLGEGQGNVLDTLVPVRRLQRRLVDGGGIAAVGDARLVEDPGAGAAGRGQDEGRRVAQTPASRPWRRLKRWRMVAAVSSMERRVTSITGQPCWANRRRAPFTSSDTVAMST